VQRLARYPELRFLDRYDALVPAALFAVLYLAGSLLKHHAPALGTNGPQLAVWGFCISTVALYHATFTINSLAHRWGGRRYATRDDSRNNVWLALLTFGEGWHNNHHHYPAAARQGFYWWEVDLTYYGLRLLAAMGLIRDLREVPVPVRQSRLESRAGS
jgi:stearoyl-CoA desaturase (delta-9 desaturase)